MAKLFNPLTIRDLTFKNRIMVSPMCEYSSIDGFANDWHLVHLGSRAVGGAGIVFTEAAAVSSEGRITSSDLGIYFDEHTEALKRITDFIHKNDSIAGIQLAHAGRKASHTKPWEGSAQVSVKNGGWRTKAPSAVAYKEGKEAPEALTKEGIQKVVQDFAKATERALEARFKIIEIHGAHGYLIHEFLSPFSNNRTDEYGGSFENRIRLLLEITDATREIWPERYPLFVRISATDWVEGGWNIEESVQLASILKTKGVDLIDCSSGGNIPNAKVPVGPGYQVPFAERIKKESGILTAAVGLITEAQQAENILNQQQADLIVMARQLLRDPYFPLHAAAALGVDMKWPDQYERAKNK